ncbi:MAG: MBL fold metallo-hydrolase [Patescibacteria group bacterium]|nr:MBL fold metallo-hydrolase [Patescibacteria group bacterium]
MATLRLHRLGRHTGRNEIEPSCGLLDVVNRGGSIARRIVVDCGSVIDRRGSEETFRTPDFSAFGDGRKIGSVYLTHAHNDHVGGLPGLAPHLAPDALIYATTPTVQVLEYLLDREIETWDSDTDSLAKPYGRRDVIDVLSRLQAIERPGQHEIGGLDTWVQPTGHIGGACSFTFRIDGCNVLYTGDVCDHDQPSILGAVPTPDEWRPDVVPGTDCTYGATEAEPPNWRAEMDRLADKCDETLRRGGKMLIYVFSLHRGGTVAGELARRGITQSGQVFLDGTAARLAPMMTDPSYSWCNRDRQVSLKGVKLIEDRQMRQIVAESVRSLIAIVPPGMGGPGGCGTWWRQRFLPVPGATVAFTGYVAEGTDGDKILKAAKLRDELGRNPDVTFSQRHSQRETVVRTMSLRCDVEHYRLGGHNGRRRTIDGIHGLGAEVVVVSHGSPAALDSVTAELRSRGGMTVFPAHERPAIEVSL